MAFESSFPKDNMIATRSASARTFCHPREGGDLAGGVCLGGLGEMGPRVRGNDRGGGPSLRDFTHAVAVTGVNPVTSILSLRAGRPAFGSSTNKGRLTCARRPLFSEPQGLVNFRKRLELVVRRGARQGPLERRGAFAPGVVAGFLARGQ